MWLGHEKRSKESRGGVHGSSRGREPSGTVDQQCHKMQSYGSWDGAVKGPSSCI